MPVAYSHKCVSVRMDGGDSIRVRRDLRFPVTPGSLRMNVMR